MTKCNDRPFQIRIDRDTLLSLKGSVAAGEVSQFVRDAIREKLARDVYGVVSVPTPQTIRQGIAAAGNGDRDELPPPGERGDMDLYDWMVLKRKIATAKKAAS